MCGETLLAGIIKMRSGFKVGDTVTIDTGKGDIDKTSIRTGQKLYRVNDRWMLPEGLFREADVYFCTGSSIHIGHVGG